MGLFSIFKKNKKNNEDDAFTNEIKGLSNTAVAYAREFNKQFDYSAESIESLEEILDYYSKDISVSKPTDNQIWSMSLIFGSYLGETILKNGFAQKGYRWGKEGTSRIPLLVCDDGWRVTPIDKVYKRLVNGSSDSVVSFYFIISTHDHAK